MDSNKNYRIRTNVNEDSFVNVNLTQDFDFLEILSLKLKQSDLYKFHTSNYGVIVGRVLANEAFGIPNAKVSVFIPIDSDDNLINNFYSFSNVTDTLDDIRYNLLKDESSNECYNVVGTFPNKRLMLDNDVILEIYDNYYKLTTVTNNSGDYMIPCVPVGNQTIHVDIDLSDIGVLSQRPYDMIYKGYNIEQFENANQFKKSTNLDSLAQLYSQNTNVYVYPLWGDEEEANIAITRNDVQIQYKFEPTCVFIGSLVTDTPNSYINHKCKAHKETGFMRNMSTGEGTIEMIRKTIDGTIEEYQVQGTNLINGNGVWCYQIPMNLDYVVTDEFGNIVPTDNPTIGIPTRTSARFRVSITNDDNPSDSKHTAKYLIPNNPHDLTSDQTPRYNGTMNVDYEFGSNTKDESFRDLFWNKVYTVKNYIPRYQLTSKTETRNYSSIRTVNYGVSNNPVPYNAIRFRLSFLYKIMCLIISVFVYLVATVNTFISLYDAVLETIACPFKRLGGLAKRLLGWLCIIPFYKILMMECFEMGSSFTEEKDTCDDGKVSRFYPGCKDSGKSFTSEKCNCNVIASEKTILEYFTNALAEDNEVVNLDFNNDWINGTLYLPLWLYRKKRKKRFLFWPRKPKIKEEFCDCEKNNYSMKWIFPFPLNNRVDGNGSSMNFTNGITEESLHKNGSIATGSYYGLIKRFTNSKGQFVYYYNPCFIMDGIYYRQYATDIVLLGSLNSCDIDGIPQAFVNLPSSTYSVPPYSAIENACDGMYEMSGMDWFGEGFRGFESNNGLAKYSRGLFANIGCSSIQTFPKTILNVERLCELGVTNDVMFDVEIPETNGTTRPKTIYVNGMMDTRKIIDDETRSMFASLNHNNLKTIINEKTGYPKYDISYKFLNGFDGRLQSSIDGFGGNKDTFQDPSIPDYIRFRFGSNAPNGRFYQGTSFPLYNNSLYFYFGIKDGDTAIDEFNKKYWGVCQSSSKDAYSISFSNIKSGGWCDDGKGEFTFSIKGLSRPFNYEVINTENNSIVSSGTSNSLSVTISGINNGTYKVTATDENGLSVTSEIEVESTPSNAIISSSNLIEPSIDDCQKFIDENKNGKIVINSFIIDSETFKISGYNKDNKIITVSDGNGNNKTYKLALTNSKGEDVLVGVIKNEVSFDNTGLYIPICKADSYTIVITQTCGENLTSDYISNVITINEPLKMTVFLNGVYLGLIEDWQTGWENTSIKGWDKILNTSTLSLIKSRFPDSKNEELWEKLLGGDLPEDEDVLNFMKEKFAYKLLFDINARFNVLTNTSKTLNIEIYDGTEPFITLINCNQDNEYNFEPDAKRVYYKNENTKNVSSASLYNYPTLTHEIIDSIFEDE